MLWQVWPREVSLRLMSASVGIEELRYRRPGGDLEARYR